MCGRRSRIVHSTSAGRLRFWLLGTDGPLQPVPLHTARAKSRAEAATGRHRWRLMPQHLLHPSALHQRRRVPLRDATPGVLLVRLGLLLGCSWVLLVLGPAGTRPQRRTRRLCGRRFWRHPSCFTRSNAVLRTHGVTPIGSCQVAHYAQRAGLAQDIRGARGTAATPAPARGNGRGEALARKRGGERRRRRAAQKTSGDGNADGAYRRR